MNRFDYVRPATVAEAVAAAAAARQRLSRGRHQPARPDEGRRQPPEPAGRRHPPSRARPDRAPARWRRAHRRAGAQRRPRATTPTSHALSRRSPKRCSPAPRPSCATPRPSAATCCSGRAAPISMTRRAPATSAQPGAGCDARGGENRLHAVLGWSESLHRHASVRFLRAARRARRRGRDRGAGRAGARSRWKNSTGCPATTPERESVLEPGELIVAAAPAGRERRGFAAHARYLKLRERTSYAFAVVSAAACLRIEDGIIAEARLALGGVAAKPWRARAAEAALAGAAPGRGRLPPRRRGGARRRDVRPATTPSRSSSRGGSSRARWPSPRPERPSACPPCPASPFAPVPGGALHG